MSDNKAYYYMRLKENFFDSDELVILESMENGYIYSNILLKLYLRSLKRNGKLMLNDTIPYNAEILGKVTRHDKYTVETALKLFESLGLVEILDSGAIYMLNIQNFIGKSSTEADRQRDYQRRIDEEKVCKKSCKESNKKSNKKSVTNVQEISEKSLEISTPEIEIEKEIDIEIEKEKRESINYQQIADMYNDICISFPRITKLSETRKKAIRARMKQYTTDDFCKMFELAERSSFLKGQNARNWSATFDWMLKDANMAKILDGNYEDKKEGEDIGEQSSESRGQASDWYYELLRRSRCDGGSRDPDTNATRRTC